VNTAGDQIARIEQVRPWKGRAPLVSDYVVRSGSKPAPVASARPAARSTTPTDDLDTAMPTVP
jgi:hypothetical protein